MEITGRVTADAEVRTTKSGKELTSFSIAIKDSFRPKGGELKTVTTYIKCAYWRSTKVAAWVKKGALLTLAGRIGMDVYTNMQGEAAGSLTFNVSEIKVLAFPRRKEGSETANAAPNSTTGFTGTGSGNTGNTPDDLPF